MPLYRIHRDAIEPVAPTTFAHQGLQERHDLQRLLKAQIEVVSPDTLIVAEEFGDWQDSRRRIDLLGMDKAANLVVIELKRTRDGGHMELQAIRYAAMISTLTFEKLVGIHARYLRENSIDADAAEHLLDFLEWSEPDEEQFGQAIGILLVSAGFSRELTTSVLWLNDQGLDIRCVRMQPYRSDGQVFLDVQTLIPVPEAEDYQVRIREKKRKERDSRKSARDHRKFDVEIFGQRHLAQTKRGMMFHLVSGVLANGGTPQQVIDAIPWRMNQLFADFDGELSGAEVQERIMQTDSGGKLPKTKRFYCDDDEIFHHGGKTYALSNQWGAKTLDAANALNRAFPHLNIRFEPSGE